MFSSLPSDGRAALTWSWGQFEPYYHDLTERPLSATNLSAWLADWSRIDQLVSEVHQRLLVAANRDTGDQETGNRFAAYLDGVFPPSQAAQQRLAEKLIASGLPAPGFEVPLRNLKTETGLFREQNLPLISAELKLGTKFDEIVGSQTVEWEGQELTVFQLAPELQEIDRGRRERAWRLSMERQLANREAINALWVEFLQLRLQQAANAGLPDYRAYRWRKLLRFDYTPEDCAVFRRAIETVVVPFVSELHEKRRRQLGLKSLRPWDLDVDPLSRPPLRPFSSIDELVRKTAAIFHHVDPQLGAYFDTMRASGMLDLDNRKHKAVGGYCTEFETVKLPFIFMNAVGVQDDVQTLVHEGGHAFHSFESFHLPYRQQRLVTLEFSEVASMSMELLGAPYLSGDGEGFYTPAQAARARIAHLESMVQLWPYMAVVDAFQHWVYENPAQAADPARCDATWASLWARFMPGVDWSGFEDVLETGWHRKVHIHLEPFYYVEYGLAQLGAFQIWRNALRDQAGAVAAYRRALALGGTAALPELFAAAGARFAFDARTLSQAVELARDAIAEFEQVEEK